MPQGVGNNPDHIPSVTSDVNGRFTIKGIGAGRLARLVLTSETTAIRKAMVATCDFPKVKYEDPRANMMSDGLIHGCKMTLVCEPSQPIEGVVVDRETKQPLVGVFVTSYGFLNDGPEHMVGQTDLKTTTDQNGRFRLAGFPKGAGNSIIITTPTTGELGKPYITQTADVPDGQGIDAIPMEVGLQRGVWIHGRVTNKETGSPIVDAGVSYMPFDDNPAAQKLDQARQQLISDYYGARTDETGQYRFVGLPGPAAMGVWVFSDPSYPAGQGLDSITEKRKRNGQLSSLFFRRINPLSTAVVVIDPADSGMQKDFQLSKGESVVLNIVDANDDPVPGAKISFLPALVGRSIESQSSSIEIDGFPLNQKRTLLLQHPEKKLGAFASIVATTHEISGFKLAHVVVMQPYGTLKLRLIDKDGNPIVGGEVSASRLSESGARVPGYFPRCEVDGEGHVSCELIPGDYSISVRAFQGAPGERRIEIKSGETLDLGEIDAANIGPTTTMAKPNPGN